MKVLALFFLFTSLTLGQDIIVGDNYSVPLETLTEKYKAKTDSSEYVRNFLIPMLEEMADELDLQAGAVMADTELLLLDIYKYYGVSFRKYTIDLKNIYKGGEIKTIWFLRLRNAND